MIYTCRRYPCNIPESASLGGAPASIRIELRSLAELGFRCTRATAPLVVVSLTDAISGASDAGQRRSRPGTIPRRPSDAAEGVQTIPRVQRRGTHLRWVLVDCWGRGRLCSAADVTDRDRPPSTYSGGPTDPPPAGRAADFADTMVHRLTSGVRTAAAVRLHFALTFAAHRSGAFVSGTHPQPTDAGFACPAQVQTYFLCKTMNEIQRGSVFAIVMTRRGKAMYCVQKATLTPPKCVFSERDSIIGERWVIRDNTEWTCDCDIHVE